MKTEKPAKKAKSGRKTASIQPRYNCILDHIEKILEISKKGGIDKCLSTGKKHLDYVSGKLGINHLQAVLFSHFIGKNDDNHIYIGEIANSLNCSNIRILKYLNECEELEKKKLLRCCRTDENTSYRVPRDVCESLRKNDEYRPQKTDNLTVNKFFNISDRIFMERNNGEYTYSSMKTELLDLVNQNMQLGFCQKIKSYSINEDDIALLIRFCDLVGNHKLDYIQCHNLEFMYDDDFFDTQMALIHGSHALFKSKLIEFSNNNGFEDSDSWKLTDKAKKELLSELKENRSNKNLISCSKIKPRTMFYNSRENEAIQKLVSLLSEGNFQKIQKRLDAKGMRKGFACLFSGSPGTGKTETAYQIARKTKRDIMMVDISDIKSKWFGESEKKVKEIFDTYRSASEKSKITPILLINEADAVIGRRKEFNASSRAVDQTENTIQNIILQEMENLSGILIATTNLTKNMDSAFERRFLYKIEFDKPTTDSRRNIWNSMLPDLNKEMAEKLSARFELSGGQIENIARKTEVDAIINGNDLSMDILTEYCKDELMNVNNPSKRIGFIND